MINWSDLLANMAHNATLIAYICHLSVIYGFADTRNTCHRPLFAILVLQKNVSFWRGFFRIDGIRINFYRCHQSVTSCIYIYVLCSIYLYYDIYIYVCVLICTAIYIYMFLPWQISRSFVASRSSTRLTRALGSAAISAMVMARCFVFERFVRGLMGFNGIS